MNGDIWELIEPYQTANFWVRHAILMNQLFSLTL